MLLSQYNRKEFLWSLSMALEHPSNGRSPERHLRKGTVAILRWNNPALTYRGEDKEKVKGQSSNVGHREIGGSMLTSKDCHWVWRKCFWFGRDRVQKNFRIIWQTNPVTVKSNNYLKIRNYFPYIVIYFNNSFLSQTWEYWYLKARILKRGT